MISHSDEALTLAPFESTLKPIGLLICFLNELQMLFLPGYGTIQVSSGSAGIVQPNTLPGPVRALHKRNKLLTAGICERT
jgi:hypothetical protein